MTGDSGTRQAEAKLSIVVSESNLKRKTSLKSTGFNDEVNTYIRLTPMMI